MGVVVMPPLPPVSSEELQNSRVPSLDLLVGKVARPVQDGEILHLLKLMLKASGKRGVPPGEVLSSLLANIYLTEVDAMVERGTTVTQGGSYRREDYAR